MRILERLALVMLAALSVVVLTWLMAATPFDPKREMAAEQAAAKGQTAMPGSEAALRKGIDDILAGRRGPRERQEMQKLGALQSVEYLGGGRRGLLPGTGDRFDHFRMKFHGGTLGGVVLPGKDGALALAGWGRDAPPTPQQVIEGYASFSAGVRAQRTAVQFGVLLLAALIGRLIFRLRL
jgi:hypothetical protein